MIQKLRFKFVLINMSIVTLMLCVILGLVFYFTSADLEQESIRMMQNIAAQPFQQGTPMELGEDVRLPFLLYSWGHVGSFSPQAGGTMTCRTGTFWTTWSNRSLLPPSGWGCCRSTTCATPSL